ncbi:hypothetical protein WJX79_008016 [Trebouxia sp. C0005]
MIAAPAVSTPAPVRLPDAPPLPMRRMPETAAKNASSLALSVQPGELQDQQQPLLPQPVPLSAGFGYKDRLPLSMAKSEGKSASAEPQTQPQLHSLQAAARGCAVSKNHASLPLDHPVDQRGPIQQHEAETAAKDQQACKGGFATPEVPWRSRTKPAIAPDRAISRMAPSSTKRRSAPRQMKRLYNGLSQEEVLGPELYETPEQVQVRQRRAQEEEEDSALLVNYGSSMSIGTKLATLHGRVSHAHRSGVSFGSELAASRELHAASGPMHSGHAQSLESALLFDIDDLQQPHGGTPSRPANKPAEQQVPSSGMLIDIADSPGPQQQQPRLAAKPAAQRRSTQGQASDKAAHCQSADDLASCAGRPLKRLRKAGQSEASVSLAAEPSAAYGHDEGEDDALQHALWLSSQQPQNSTLLTGTAAHAANQEADDCQEEQGLHAEAYEHHQPQKSWPKAASSGFNSARDLFLQQQSNKKEDIAERGKAANPFARLNAKSKQSLTEVPRSIQAASRESGVSAEALQAVLHPTPNADLWKRRLHGDAAEHSGAGTSTLAERVVGSEVIDLIGSPEEEEEGLLSNGPPWWERLPDFVPLSALKWGTNPRDGATVHINYKAQFSGQPAARGHKKVSAREDLGNADDDIEMLDVEDENVQSTSKRSRSSKGRKHGSSSHDAREGGEGHTECRQGQWIHKNNHKVYIDANGRTLTGSRAYAKAQQDKGLSTNPAGHRARNRKSPGKRKRKSRAKGSKLPNFCATKSRFS